MKRFILLLFFTTISTVGIIAQQSPPEAGSYYCYTTGLSNDPYANNSIQVTPAFFGDIVMDGKGNYSLTRKNTKGRYTFTKSASKLTFTGDLSIMTVSDYTSNGFSLSYKTFGFNCNLRGSTTKPTANPSGKNKPNTILNEGLTGKILTTASYRFNNFLERVIEFNLAKGASTQILSDGVAAQNPKGEIFYFNKSGQMKIADSTGNTTIKVIDDKTGFNFDDYFPAISASGDFVAYTTGGTQAELKGELVKVAIVNRDGKQVASFPGFTHAAWLSDGRIVVAGAGKSKEGLYIIDANFRRATELFEGGSLESATMPAVSPDGKTLAFVKNGEIWTINLDGTNRMKILYGSQSSFPAWSPDGRFIASSTIMEVNHINKAILVIVNLKEDKAIIVKDNKGEPVETRNRINWLP